MARDDIKKMIEDALAAPEEKRAGPKPIAHAQHILTQYVKLCGDPPPPEAEGSGDVELPAMPAESPPPRGSTNPISRVVKNALARVKR
jgi:hypothetical protein